MSDVSWLTGHADTSLRRLWPRIRKEIGEQAAATPEEWQGFETRLRREWERLFSLLLTLYGQHYDFYYHLEQVLRTAAQCWAGRPNWLRKLDDQRLAEPQWFQSQEMLAGVLYVDLYCGTLANLSKCIPYFKELGLTYLHIMPLFESPASHNDGGYAVSSYRRVNPALGSIEQLASLAEELHANGISLALDFVFNHTSDEHDWARCAQSGDPDYQAYYHTFPDRSMPDAYERTLREIFPTVRRGSFTWNESMRRWVWTTFHSYQWDLNYSNPEVFRAMAEEMLFLANVGAEVLRLDAVAFIWKWLGTNCENQPEAHLIIQAMNAMARIAAPALLFKSEAIVHPDEVARYVSPAECQLSYNPLLMSLLWETCATREVRLIEHSMRTRGHVSEGCAWINYLRSHDDIGWTFDDADARQVGIDPIGHRWFLNAFYTGQFQGSFSRGLLFQQNLRTGDARVSGTLASLAGLEQAIEAGDNMLIDMALRRILLMYSVIMSAGGIPLIYLGDELATLNDCSYTQDPSKANDSRWVHRPPIDLERAERRKDASSIEGRLYTGLQRLIELRRSQTALWDGVIDVLHTGNPHVLAYARRAGGERLVIIANFSDFRSEIDPRRAGLAVSSGPLHDLVSRISFSSDGPLTLDPCQFMWIKE